MIESEGYSADVLGKAYPGQDCALASALEVIGERWTLLIIRDAFFGVQRFDDFADHLDIPRAVLSDRLNALITNGILEKVTDGGGRRYSYRLTPAGEELWPVLYSLINWGSRHRHPSTRRYTHATCGSSLDRSAACPTCGVLPSPHDVVIALGPNKRLSRDDAVSVAMRRPHRLLEPLDTASVRARNRITTPTSAHHDGRPHRLVRP